MIHIACNIDRKYVPHCAVTLVSLFENNPKEAFTVHVVAQDLAANDRDILTALSGKYGNEVRYYVPDARMLEGFTIRATHNRLSLTTYYRCFLSVLLPEDIDRVLYLDCDTVVLGDITPLWRTPLDDHTGVAAVEDTGCKDLRRYEILQYPAEDSYFNSGVLLVNLAYWREHRIAQACTDYYRAYPERIIFNDQDLLNSVLHQHKTLVGLQWNVQDGFYRNRPAISPETRRKPEGGGKPACALPGHDPHGAQTMAQAHAEALKRPVILHYTNRKPWSYDSQHPLRDAYFHYLDLTPWKGERPWHSAKNRLKRFFRLLPYYIGIRKAKYIRLESL